MPALTAKQVVLQLQALPDWSKHGRSIRRTFEFADFLESVDFVDRIARKAQRMQHHPDIDIRYDQVILTLTTHDAGGLTEKDFSLAAQCREIFSKFFKS
jgi:4a-hydroxytetrahydrobiopterin dehydratase